ncbi:DUF7507 domain-containing protein [Litorimonas sp. WD9-15]|uniref:DUF7507 domain-containing protein n=1 Tax=Litorimonas sp. WD9-15 TaxID=3418716 RepID=UPI003D00E004
MPNLLYTLFTRTKRLLSRTAKASAVAALLLGGTAASQTAWATTFTETVPNGNGPIPDTYPAVGGTMFVLIGVNGNIYYQFVNPSTQFQGFAGTGTPTAFRGIPTFQLGPQQTLNCGIVSCSDYFGGSIAEGYARLTVRDADACPGNFDFEDVAFLVNGIEVSSLSNLGPTDVQRTNLTGTTQIASQENCFRNQGTTETSTGWFDLPGPLLTNILSVGSTTPFIRDDDTGSSTTRGDNAWFFQDGVDATGTPEVAPGVTIEKMADRTDYDAVGDIINYSFEVTNIGSVRLNSIVVDDSFITGAVSCPFTSLNSGDSMTCTGQHIVTQENIDNDVVFVNTAEVTANPTEGQLGNVSGTLSIPGPAANNVMTLTKVADKTTNLTAGETVTYTYVATNNGNITLNDVNITDVHSGEGTLSAVTPASVSLAPNGGSQTFTSTYVVTQADIDSGADITNTATANSTPRRGTIVAPTADESISVTAPTPEAVFSKIASPDSDLEEGDTVTYTYTVQNTGNVTLTNTSVSDVHSGSGTLSAITPTGVDIAPGTSQDFTATYVITQDDFDSGANITNTATLNTTPARGTLGARTADESVSLAAPAPSATMTKLADDDTDVVEGQTLTYTYNVVNTGDVTLEDVTITDVHAGTGTLSAITPATADIPVGGNQDFTATYVVQQTDIDAGVAITNTATANATPTRGVFTPATADESVTTAGPAPAATLSKTADKTTDVVEGDTITYTYVFENTGNVTLTNISVSDVHNGEGTLSAIAPATVATLLPGDDVSFTATYVVLQEDIDAGGPITNTATGNATPANGSFTPPTDGESLALATPNASATLVKTPDVSTDLSAGDTVTYTYRVTNNGTVTLSNLSVSDVHSGEGTLSAVTPANVTTLAVGDFVDFTATYLVTQEDIDTGAAITNTATLSATPSQGTLVPTTDDASVAVEAATPSTTLTKTASDDVDLVEGQTITYTYVVANDGNVDLTAVSISDVHSGTGTLSAIIPASVDLAPTESQTFTATYQVTQADVDAGTAITNTATANATPARGTYTPTTADESVAVEAATPAATLTKTASDDTDVVEGQTITYTYVVTNTGNVGLDNVSLSDSHSGTGTLSAITPASVDLAPTESQTFTATYVVTQDDVNAATPITNTATLAATPKRGTLAAVTADESVTVEAPNPLLTVVKTASDTTDVQVGDTITYTYAVVNTGNVTMENVSISDVQSGAGALSAITPASVTLQPGDSQDFTATYVVQLEDIDAGTDITNTATVNATPAAGSYTPVTDNETVTVEAANPLLTVVKTASQTTNASVGDIITYTYVVQNTGNVSMTAVSVSDAHSGVGALSAITPASVDLDPGQSQTFTATYEVLQADIDAGTSITNTATVAATPARGTYTPATDDETVTLEALTPDVDFAKTVSKSSDLVAGETITYSYLVINSGNVTLTDVGVSDVHGGTGTLTAITPASVDLAPMQSQTFTATYVITQEDIDSGADISNTATVNAVPATGTFTPETDDETVSVEAPNPALTFTKSASQTSGLAEGDIVTYSYTATNSGNVTMNGVSISDVHSGTGILSAITPASVDLAPTESQIFTATYTITQADIDSGADITNTATAAATPALGAYTPVTADETVAVNAPAPELSMTKTADATADVEVGQVIIYSYEVTNSGNITITGVSVSDVHSGSGTLSAITPASVDLAPMESQIFTATYTITQEDIDSGADITNTATADGTPANGALTPATADETVSPEAAAPNATFTKTASDTTDVSEGDTITYTYVVTNTGNVGLDNVSVSDVQSGTGTLSAITPASVDLAPTESQTFTATYVVTQDDIDAGTDLTNTATLAATPKGGTLAPMTADETVTVEGPNPLLDVQKTASKTANVLAGDIITYSYRVENTGNVSMTNVSVSDVHSGQGTLSAITPASVDLEPGEVQIFTATYEVTQGDIDSATPITNTATVSATPARGSYIPATDDETVTPDPGSPDVIFNKVASKTANLVAGETITYSYTAQNTGNTTLTNVSVSDVHQGDGTLSAITPASVASLAPGATATFTATYEVTQGDIDAGVAITNTATLTATPATGVLNPVDATESVTPETSGPELTVAKTADATADLSVGETITYTYRVTNTGNVTMADISVSDVHSGSGPLSAITPATVATLAIGDFVDFTATYVVTQEDIDAATPITNTATVAATPPSGTYVPATDDENVVLDGPAPELTLVKTADVTADAAAGDTITYTYRVTNSGNVTVNNVMVSDVHEGTGPFGAITPANVPTLDVGQFADFTATYVITQADIDAGTPVTNTATANATPVAGTLTPATDSESVSPDAPAPLVDFAKTADITTDVAVGDIITYTYTATNTGNVTLTNVSVSDVHDGTGTLSAITPANIATLAVGQTVSFTASYEVTQADIDSGTPITNTATFTGTPSGGTLPPTTDTESVGPETPAPVLTLDKRATSTDFVMVGDELTYEYDVANTGNVTISGISVSDDKIATINCPVTELAPGASTTCTATYEVTQADLDTGSVTNIASVDGAPTGGTLVPPTDTETVGGTQSPALTLAKTAIDTDFAMVGDELSYEYLVTNTGNVEITDLVVSDDKITTVVCPVTTLAPTEFTTCTATYAVTQEDLDAGSVTNIASANATPAGGTLTPAGDTATVDGTQSPALTLEKTALTSDFAAIGDTLEYEYLVTNTGNVTISSAIEVEDDKITVPAIVTCPALPAGGLQPTQSLTCTASYSVTQADLDTGFVTNIASASDGTTTSPTDDATVSGTQSPVLTIAKIARETEFDAIGDLINYDYTVTNTGNVGIADIVVTDDKIASVTCNVAAIGNGDAILDPTESVVCTGTYEVTQADLDTGSVTNLASAGGTPNGGTLTPPETSETVDAVQMPALTLAKAAGETSFNAVGDILTYTYTVTNTGNVLVSDITVTDDKIATVVCDVAAIGNNDDNLDPTETVICTANYEVTQEDLDAGSVTNNAEASGTPAGGTLAPAGDDETVDAVQTPSLETVKTATDVNFELPGDITTYEYVVTNTGNVTITDPITVTDNLIATVNCPALPTGGLAPNASLTCTATYEATQADLDAGQVTNLASATDGTTTSTQTSETIPADQSPALSIVKTPLFSDFTMAGDVVEYQFDVTNEGNVTLTGGVDVIDDKIGTISCVTGNLTPGATQTCTASYTITQADIDAGEVMNQAFAQNGTLVSAPVDVTVTGTRTPSLGFVKRATTAEFVNAGDVINYEFDVENTGNVTLTSVSVSDDIIANVVCPLTELAPAQTMVCTASYTVTQADVDAGEVVNNASVAGTPPGGGTPTETPGTTTVGSDAQPSLTFDKRAVSTAFDMVGDILSYEFDVENTGSVTLSNIVIEDDLIASVICPLTTLAPAQSMVCSATYEVTQADVDAGEVINNASAKSDLPNGDPLPEVPDTVTISGDQTPSLSVVKNALTNSFDAVGDIVDFEVIVTNTGNVSVSGIVVDDPLIPSLSCSSAALAPTASFTCTGSYTVTQADIDNGSLTNTVSVSGTPAGGTLSPVGTTETVDADLVPGLTVVKTAQTSDFTRVGDTINYDYLVTNSGNTTLTDPISITDDKIASVSCPVIPAGGLAPTESLTCSATYVVTQADLDAGQVTNLATATDGINTSPEVSETVGGVQTPSLAMTKTASPQTYAAVGDMVTYSYVITNTGNVTVTDALSVSDDRIASVACPALPAGGLVPGASLTCTGTDTVSQEDIDNGSVTNRATGTDGTTTTDPVDETVSADLQPALAIEKSARSTSFTTVGEIVDYDYLVTNTGNVTITEPITVSDDKIASVSCPALPGGRLAPNASLTCSAQYEVTQADIDAGEVTNVASARTGTTVSSTDDVTVPATQTPALSVVKSALETSFSAPGDVLSYEYRVRNTGNVTLTGNISVADDKIENVICPALPMAGLQPNEEIVCTATYLVTQADLDAGEVTNIASASNGGTTSPTDSATVEADDMPALSIRKSSDLSTFNTPGQIITYTFDVTNTGNVTLTDPVTVSDNRIPDVTCPALPAGGLVPGASITCTGTDEVEQADIDVGVVENTASAASGDTESDETTRRVFATRTAELVIEKTATNIDFTLPGDIVTYEYVVTNSGNTTITDPITVSDNRIPNVVCPALPTDGLAPDASLTCTADYVVTQDNLDIGVVVNIATATDGTTTSAPDSETIPANANPALEIRKSSDELPFSAAGDILTYSFEIENSGNVTLTGNISVTDNRIGTFVCYTGNFIPGQIETCTADYEVTQADMDRGSVTNDAFATHPRTNSPTDFVTIPADQQPEIGLVKDAVTTEFTNVGDTLDYTYTVTNLGNVTIMFPVSISDDRIPDVTCDALPAGGLAPGGTLICRGTDTVSQEDIDAGFVTNTATATDGTTTSTPQTETIGGVQAPELTIEKLAQNSDFTAVGDTLDYNYVVTNTGNITLTDPVTITDDRIDTVTCPALPIGGLQPGATLLCTATDTVTQADLDAGFVTNTASARSGATQSDEDDATVTGTQTPELSLEKTATSGDFSAAGDIVSYDYVVTNTGNVTVTAPITVSDDKIASVTCPALPAGGLAPTQTLTCSADYEITQADVDAGFVTNLATATDGETSSEEVSETAEAAQAPSLTLVKTALTTEFAAAGDTLDYEYLVTNSGNTTITQAITIRDDRIAAITCPALPAGGLLPNASITCTATDTLDQADIDAGTVTNVATATDGTTSSNEETETVSGNITSAFTIDKVAQTNDFSMVGDVLSYDFIIRNTGNVTLTDAFTVSDDKIGEINCPTNPGLVPNATLTCSADYEVTQADLDAGQVTNIATASSGGETSEPDVVTITGTQTPELTIEKSTETASLTAAGQFVTYNYLVTNTGNTSITTPITVTDDKIADVICPALPADGLAPQGTLTCSADYTVTQADLDAGQVTNIATASDGETTSAPDTVTVETEAEESLLIVKRATTEGFSAVGDIVSYEYDVTNTGNLTLTTPVTVSDDKIADVTCPALPAGGLAPQATLTCSADYAVTQADLDAGQVTNLATATSGGSESEEVSETVEAMTNPELDVRKTTENTRQMFGPIFEVTYNLELENTGNVTLTNVQLEDDLAASFAPATLVGTPTLDATGVTANSEYDGVTITDLLAGLDNLAVGEMASLTLTAQLDITNGVPAQGNTAFGSSPALPQPVASDDETITPNTPEDTNPAPVDLGDEDGDGAPDRFESPTADRDGDGIPDSMDYDPTGYFYCEENGNILPGGGISVAGPAGVNSAVGTLNNIVIVEDGSNGFYQFYVTAPGRYTLTPTYPDTGLVSTARLPIEEGLDVSTRTDNPAILGSSEVGDTGQIADFSADANAPFYFEFEFEAGDPSVLLNNIPLRACGIPAIELAKSSTGDPERLDDGRQLVSYNFDVTNTGETLVEDIRIEDDLAAVFGIDRVEVQTLDITAAPDGFAGQVNPGFDGQTVTDLLIGAGDLAPGEILSLNLQAAVNPAVDGEYTNVATVSATGPRDTGDISGEGTATLELLPLADASFLRVTKTASPRTVQIGDPVLYTISVTNESASTLTGVDIVDRLPEGFAYVPNSSRVSDASDVVELEPTVRSRGVLSWSLNAGEVTPLDALQPGETISVNLQLLAGPNVTFGAHENQAFAENTATGTRSDIATAVVDYIPEPSFDCTPVIGRVYDDVNVNGYPDDGEPGLPGVRLVTVNGDIITTDEYGRYHIPCAILADAENGSNFLLKADTRTLPLGYAPTTENPRVVRATRGKFVKMNFGAGFRTKLRVDFMAEDFNLDGTGIAAAKVQELQSFLAQNDAAERAVLVFNAEDDMSVDAAQARLQVALEAVRDLAPNSLKDIALEASWGQAKYYEESGNIAGEVFGGRVPSDEGEMDAIKDNGRENGTDRQAFALGENGLIGPVGRDALTDRDEDRRWNNGGGLRDNHTDQDDEGALASDTRRNRASVLGRRDRVTEADQSPAPGRLQRWLGWGNSTSAYVDSMELETTVDSLDPVKRLNAQVDVVNWNGVRTLKAATYSNYAAFTDRLEIRVFDARRSARGEPLFTIPVTGTEASMAVPDILPENMLYILRAYGKDGAFDDTAPKRLRVGEAKFDLTESEWVAEAPNSFGQNTLQVSNILVRGGAVRVYGRNVAGETATVMGEQVRVDEQGRFVMEQLLPAGEQSVMIEAGGQTIARMVDVKARETFYVAQVEATIGQRIGDDDTFEEGRVAFYVRSRLNDRWTVTATADTGEAGLGDLVSTLDDKDLDQLLRRLDPDRYYPTYGDNSTIEQDAPTSGRIYARVERDDDYALWGNYQTDFNDTEFARVNRTLYGAKLHWDENGFTTLGDARTAVTAFIAEGGTRQARDELRGTGGSVYYLRHGDISIGSEQLRVETRDSVSGLVTESRRLQYGTDYDLDFIQGRVILTRPLGSTGDDGRLFRDGSQSGNAQVLVADYEFTPVFGANDTGAVYGARAKRWFGDHVKLGATYNHSDDGGVESDLYEMDLTLQYAAGTYIKGEIARSEGLGVETFASIDGGFTYNAADRGEVFGDENVDAMAYAIEAAVNFSEVSDLEGSAYTYWRKRQAGFAGYAEATNSSVEQFGGGMDIVIAKGLEFGARADISDSEIIGTNSFAEARVDYALNEKTTLSGGLSFNDDARGNAGASVGLRGEYQFTDDSNLYVFGQVGLTGDNTRTTDRLGVGGEVRLSKTFFGGGEVSTGEDGLGARATLRREEEDGDEYYLAYDLPLQAQPTSNYGTFNVGARKRYGDALSVFGEERLQFNQRGLNGITHAYGVEYTPGKWNFGLNGEVGRIDQLDREAFGLSTGFANERFKAGFAAEWRQDKNIDTDAERETWLLRWTSQYQASEELRLQGKFNRAMSKQTEDGDLGPVDFNEAEFTEGSIAAAYRPIWDDRFNLLAKYTYLEDLSPTSQRFGGETLNYRQISEIVSVDAAYDVSQKWTLGGKYAHRSGQVTSNRESLDFTKSSADLGVIRLDYHATHQWDLHLEGRWLDIGNGVITRTGGQAGVYRHMNDNAKLGVGVTWGGIEEQYLGALEDEDDLGWYLNLVGKF